MAKTVAICTLGCKVNAYESAAVIEQFEKNGYTQVDFDSVSDIYIINTCTVTHLSSRKSRQMIRRAKQINPDAVLVVMGCYAQTEPEAVSKIPEVDLILGTADKGKTFDAVEKFLASEEKKCIVSDISKKTEYDELFVTSYEGKTRAFLKVQDGCNNFCSYCIIPYARGRIRSRNLVNSIEEAKRLSENGYTEIVLTGIHLASYGKETGGPHLIDLISELNKIDKITRIRMGSLEPTIFDDEFTEKISKLPKVCHHFHLSLQSGCDETLERMNRKYKTKDYEGAVERIRNAMPDSAITTDILTGFPGETDEEFEKTFAFAQKIQFSDAHVFKYSIRKGTKAEKMENQVPPEVKEKRSQKLIKLTNETKKEFILSHKGKTVDVLFEQWHKGKTNAFGEDAGVFEGKTDNYITVLVKTDKDLSGRFYPVTVTDEENGFAIGEIAD